MQTRVLTPARVAVDDPAIEEAAQRLRAGELVAFPTETVYGLGADATNPAAIARIFAAKERPADNPVIVHVPSLDDAAAIADVSDPRVAPLAARFWPGPLTLVLPARPAVHAATRGLATVGVRVPDHPIALAILRATGRPLAAPSANRSGRPSPTTAAHVVDDLGGRLPLVIDGGACRVGLESTVLDLCGPDTVILRPGAVTPEMIAATLSLAVRLGRGAEVARSPGTRHPHYRPRAPVVLLGEAVSRAATEALVLTLLQDTAFGPVGVLVARPASARRVPADVPGLVVVATDELGPSLYAALREFDRRGVSLVLVDPGPLDAALEDRLARAATLVAGDDAALAAAAAPGFRARS